MQFFEAFKLALQSLWGNKLRSILSLIGVVMGVASVIMVITLVNGANTYVSTKILRHGADVFAITRMGPIFSAQDYFRFQKRKIIRIEPAKASRFRIPEEEGVGDVARVEAGTDQILLLLLEGFGAVKRRAEADKNRAGVSR